MFEVTVEDTFAAGHYLRHYKGKCENPHGHNYKIRVTLAGSELDKAGLLLDFKDLQPRLSPLLPRLENFEAMTFGPIVNGVKTLLIGSDDNFRATQKTSFLLLGMK